MSSCLRQSFFLPKKLFSCNINSTKTFSALSSLHDKHYSNYDTNQLFFKKTSKPKQIQYRYFSLDNLNSFYESIRTSEASKLVTNVLIGTHDFTGLSWSVTIIAAAAVMKLVVTLPCGIYQQYLVSKLELTKVELDEVVKRLKDATQKRAIKGQWTNSKFQSELRKEVALMWKALVVKNNCHPFKITILFFMQLPFWLLLTVAIRSLAMDGNSSNFSQMEHPVTALQFQVGGPFWCKNLSLPDPTLILPTINSLSMLTVTELSLSTRTQTEIAKNYKNFFINKILPNILRSLAVAFFFISAASPSGVSIFWMTSSLISLGQNLLLMSPKVRRILRIPKTASEVDKPYRQALNNFTQRFRKVSVEKK